MLRVASTLARRRLVGPWCLSHSPLTLAALLQAPETVYSPISCHGGNLRDFDGKYSWMTSSFSSQSSVAGQQQEAVVPQDAESVAEKYPEVISSYRSKMDTLKKRRKRVPLSTTESYESWLEENDETLEPLREFFRSHEIDDAWAIAELYKNGYWGKKLMTSRDQDGIHPWENALEVWSAAFEAEKLPHSPLDVVRRWPSLLCKTPDCLPGTVAVLRAAIPEEDVLNETISQFPRVLVQSPVKLQHRVLALQMACGMELSRILPKNPQLFYRNLEAIMTNIRFLRENCWTLEHFESLIEYRPNVLSMPPEMVRRNTTSSLEAIKMILPGEADPKFVVRAKPQLILISAAHIDERWNILKSLAEQVPEWQAELDEAIQDIVEAGSAELVASADDAAPETLEDDGGLDWEKGEWGATTLGAALWSHPKRYERLEFLIESGNIKGTSDHVPSFVDSLTVHLHRFSHRYREFNEWVDRR
jgi:hypothetical protein